MKICKNCNAQNDDSDNNCLKCGKTEFSYIPDSKLNIGDNNAISTKKIVAGNEQNIETQIVNNNNTIIQDKEIIIKIFPVDAVCQIYKDQEKVDTAPMGKMTNVTLRKRGMHLFDFYNSDTSQHIEYTLNIEKSDIEVILYVTLSKGTVETVDEWTESQRKAKLKLKEEQDKAKQDAENRKRIVNAKSVDNTQLHLVLKHIYQAQSTILFDRQKLDAYLNEMFVGADKEKRVLKQLISNGIAEKVWELKELQAAAQTQKTDAIKEYYNEEFYLPADVTARFIECFMYAFGFIDKVSHAVDKNANKEVVETKESLPEKVFDKWCYSRMGSPRLLTIPNDYTSIGTEAFKECDTLVSVTIPDSVTSIGDSAFWNCKNLTSINIPNSITSIGSHAFYSCNNLSSLIIPDSVTTIEDYAFGSCSALTSIDIPHSITVISKNTFKSCSSLSSINIPDSVTTIEDYAFSFCSSLTSIIIPDSVAAIGANAFACCHSLTSITIPDSVIWIGEKAFESCGALKLIKVSESSKVYNQLLNEYKTKVNYDEEAERKKAEEKKRKQEEAKRIKEEGRKRKQEEAKRIKEEKEKRQAEEALLTS